jgi:plasmid replication initiation protein
MRGREMNLQELRFLSIYLSRINPRECEKTREVVFPLHEFKKIMDLKEDNINYFKSVTKKLLQKVITVPDKEGGYTQFQLFKRCKVLKHDNGEWYIEINAHDDALPLMFDFKREYFKYELWNVLNLKSPSQIRMYEILKQYENIGYRILNIKELRELLGIEPEEYAKWSNFKTYVLNSCQEALSKYTDLSYTYEPYGKRGKGGKILQLKFTIIKNEDYIDKLNLKEFLKDKFKDEYPIEVESEEISESVPEDIPENDNALVVRENTSEIAEIPKKKSLWQKIKSIFHKKES